MLDYLNPPNIYFFCAGSSEGRNGLTSFDGALLKAGIGNTNLVRMSSIVPPGCEEVAPFKIKQGMLVPTAFASLTSNQEGETISSAVAAAIPKDNAIAGVIMEHSDSLPLVDVEVRVREMVKEAMEMRGITEYSIKSNGAEAKVNGFTSTFSAVVLWKK